MPLNLQLSFNNTTCKIEATFSDPQNRGRNGNIRITVSGNPPLQAPFQNLTNTPKTITFDVPKTGNVHIFDGTVTIVVDFGFDSLVAQVCPP